MSRRDLAIDLGTANTVVFQQGMGIVYAEPTVVAVNPRSGDVTAIGREVSEMRSGTPGTVGPIRPLQRGVITDFEITEQMVRLIFRRLGVGRFPKPKVLVCVPSLLTPVERRAVVEAVASAGASSVDLVDEPLAAAIGAGLPIQDPVGSFVVDVGGGTAEMAMVAMGRVVTVKAVKVGGFDMDAAIQSHIRRRHSLAIGDVTAERLKIQAGSAYPAADAPVVEVQGRDLNTGTPRVVPVTAQEVREVLGPTVGMIVESTRQCLAQSPPELAHDVLDTGLFLTGGGGMLRGLDMRLAKDCEVPVHLTEDPLHTVVVGAGLILDYLPQYRATFLT